MTLPSPSHARPTAISQSRDPQGHHPLDPSTPTKTHGKLKRPSPISPPILTPPSPSYARPTVASQARSSRGHQQHPSTPTKTPKKLKRPSTLSAHQLSNLERTRWEAQQNKQMIKPANPKKPCGFASLPTEIRQMIYESALPTFERIHQRSCLPALLCVSRRVRAEAAYIYYSRTQFQFYAFTGRLRLLDFSGIKSWVGSVPIEHRQFFAFNGNLCISLSRSWWHWDVFRIRTWELCRKFGNFYSIPGLEHKRHFVSFCLLADWLLWCGERINKDMKWNYTISEDIRWSPTSIYEELFVLDLPCVADHAAVDTKQKGVMKKEALNMLTQVNEHLKIKRIKITYAARNGIKRAELMRRHLEKW